MSRFPYYNSVTDGDVEHNQYHIIDICSWILNKNWNFCVYLVNVSLMTNTKKKPWIGLEKYDAKAYFPFIIPGMRETKKAQKAKILTQTIIRINPLNADRNNKMVNK